MSAAADGAEGGLRVVIEPQRGWIPVDLRELWRYRELVGFLALRDVKVRYKQSLLGVSVGGNPAADDDGGLHVFYSGLLLATGRACPRWRGSPIAVSTYLRARALAAVRRGASSRRGTVSFVNQTPDHQGLLSAPGRTDRPYRSQR